MFLRRITHRVTAGTLVEAAIATIRSDAPTVRIDTRYFQLTTQAILSATLVCSHLRYDESRLVSGTYGACALFAANNPYIRPDAIYRTRKPHPPGFNQMWARFKTSDDWQQRRSFFMKQVVSYWTSDPARALHGWLWRLQRFLGLHAEAIRGLDPRLWGPLIHPFAVLALLVLLAARLRLTWRELGNRFTSSLSLGVVVALMFSLYAALYSLFSYTGFRYVTGSVSTLVAAIVLLTAEACRLRE